VPFIAAMRSLGFGVAAHLDKSESLAAAGVARLDGRTLPEPVHQAPPVADRRL